MSVRIRTHAVRTASLLALSAVLFAAPAQAASDHATASPETSKQATSRQATGPGGDEPGIHEKKDAPNTFDQPYVPGYNQSPQADVRGKGAPSVATERQQANRLPDEPVPADQDTGWENRDDYVKTSQRAVDFWEDRIDGIDPETVRLGSLRERMTALEKNQKALQDSDEMSWSADRAAFEQELSALREGYMELPQARKSDSVARRPGAEAEPDSLTRRSGAAGNTGDTGAFPTSDPADTGASGASTD